jgi:hypothetical protein
VEASLDNIVLVMWCLQEAAADNMKVWVSDTIASLPARAAEDAARLQLAERLADSRHRLSYGDALESFFNACNRGAAPGAAPPS